MYLTYSVHEIIQYNIPVVKVPPYSDLRNPQQNSIIISVPHRRNLLPPIRFNLSALHNGWYAAMSLHGKTLTRLRCSDMRPAIVQTLELKRSWIGYTAAPRVISTVLIMPIRTLAGAEEIFGQGAEAGMGDLLPDRWKGGDADAEDTKGYLKDFE